MVRLDVASVRRFEEARSRGLSWTVNPTSQQVRARMHPTSRTNEKNVTLGRKAANLGIVVWG